MVYSTYQSKREKQGCEIAKLGKDAKLGNIFLRGTYPSWESSSKHLFQGYFMQNKVGVVMERLKGTKTEENLKEAFASECKARSKYTFYATQAKSEGYEKIATIFEETSVNEREHAKLWFKLLCEKEIPPTIKNLKDATNDEHSEWTNMYVRMADEARAEGFDDIAFLFDSVGAIEQRHEERYLKALAELGEGSNIGANEKPVWICRNCGHIVDNEKAPLICPLCNELQKSFERRLVNF